MAEKVKIPALDGLYSGKGQRVEDICLQNRHLSEEEVKALLDQGIQSGKYLHYSQSGEVFYLKSASSE